MEPQTFIFLGRSGCGKGTQAGKMKSYLKSQDEHKDVVQLEMGNLFRKFWSEEGYSNSLSKKIMEDGDLQPSFIQIFLWSGFLLENIKGEEHLIIDGMPRRVTDAEALDSAFKFYDRFKPNFVLLKVSRDWAKNRILERAKNDGREEDLDIKIIDSRLDWYEKFVEPSVNFFRNNSFYNFVEVDGEQSIDDVHKNILEKI